MGELSLDTNKAEARDVNRVEDINVCPTRPFPPDSYVDTNDRETNQPVIDKSPQTLGVSRDPPKEGPWLSPRRAEEETYRTVTLPHYHYRNASSSTLSSDGRAALAVE